MHEQGKLDVHRLGEAAGLGEFDAGPPRLRLLGEFPGRAPVSSSASLATRSGACRMISKQM